jgi:response regulator RpfG family c-di-GMP phosphodiesterase
MPGIDGYEFLDDVKRNESTKHIPVIIVSAVTNSKEIKKTKMLGAVDYIEKPVNIHELVNKIETTLNN